MRCITTLTPNGYCITYYNPIYLYLKEHYCPHCKAPLFLVKVSKIVNSFSPEAKDYDFSGVDTSLVGDIEFIWKEFKCPDCEAQMPIDDVKKYEALQRKQAQLERKKAKAEKRLQNKTK